LFLDRAFGERLCLEACVGDHDPALDGSTVRPGFDPRLRAEYGFQLASKVCDQGVVDHLGRERVALLGFALLLAFEFDLVANITGQVAECRFDPSTLGSDQLAGSAIVHSHTPVVRGGS
jgi:hypothetical protein